MNTNETAKMDMQVKLSTLWIVVLFNMIFADIVGFMNPGALEKMMTGAVGFEITQELLLVFAILLEIPIAMILLSRVLSHSANRLANIVASVITIVFVVGAGSAYLSYMFFATVEVVCLLLIVWNAWQWRDPLPSVQVNRQILQEESQ